MIKKHPLTHIALACLLAATLCQPALAKTHTLKPGLWQIESQTWLHGHRVPDVNAVINMGPVALQNHVQNMLRQNRMRIAENGTATICISAEQIAQNDFVNDQGSGCTVGTGKRTGNSLYFDIRCDAPKGNGYTNVSVISATKWVADSKVKLTVRNTTQKVVNQSFGTWLNDSCSL